LNIFAQATNKRDKKIVLPFYSMPEYEQWKESLGGNASGWSIKYYKGLGTSTSSEGRQYFQDIAKHKKDFVWKNDQDDNDIELAFSKKRITDRKEWLTNFQVCSCILFHITKPNYYSVATNI
jgi:DNA topoisomerase-2